MQDLAYLNGDYRPVEEVHLALTDWGFVQGVTIAEQLRTFSGKPFHIQPHLDRLLAGLRIVGWERDVIQLDLPSIIRHVSEQNHRQLDPLDDLGVSVFVTPGEYPGYRDTDPEHANVCVHTYPLPFHRWQRQYEDGLALLTVDTRQVPPDCWPPELKCRSRMHYYLAAREARRRLPGAAALLLDHEGYISETPTANVIAYFADSGLASPPREKILPGISLGCVVELAHVLGVPFEFRDLTPGDLAEADELMLTSTPFCLLPIVRFNERRLPGPGPLSRELLHAWSHKVGVDIPAQAARFARRHGRRE